jgi:hypothetical protein
MKPIRCAKKEFAIYKEIWAINLNIGNTRSQFKLKKNKIIVKNFGEKCREFL